MVAAVSREFLAQLRALAHAPYDRAQIEANILAYLTARIPDFPVNALSDNLRRALPLLAELLFLHGEQETNFFHMGQMVNAQGLYLDKFGVQKGLPRRAGENDEDYLYRLANSGLTRTLGTLESIELQVTDFQATVVDVQAVERINRQDVNVWALKAAHALLTTEERTALLAHLNLQANHIAGVRLYAPDPVLTAFTVDVTLRHTGDVSPDTISVNARQAVYNWLAAGQRLGKPVYQSAVQVAAFVVGVSDVSIAQPSANLPAVDGTAYTCPSDATNVIIRTAAI